MQANNRRPIQARSFRWAQLFASWLAKRSITPNQISVLSIFFAAGGAALLIFYRIAPFWFLLGTAVSIQGRLICNLIDGMVAVEGGKKSLLGPLYNEFPDRIADSLLLVALGYAIEIPWVGWAGALLAALSAYVRVFGGSLGLPQSFMGPMAKQHRMAVLTLACVAETVEIWLNQTDWALQVAAWVILVGSALTCVTRTWNIVKQLKQNHVPTT